MSSIAEVKAEYTAMNARAEELWEQAEPQRRAYNEAVKAFYAMKEAIEAFLEKHDADLIRSCEGCSTPIFEGEKCTGGEFNYCEDCAPTWGDMLRHPENFMGADEETLTPDEAKAICDRHLAAGGSLDDKMVS